jgi:S-disulfanyl-L-cysteine oxidoreductase SoxD
MNQAKNAESSSRRDTLSLEYVVLALLIAGALAFVGGAIRSVRAADSQKTTMDGVYSIAQAARGKAQYTQACANCHMDDLSGSGQALPLAGDAFTETWEGQSVGDLFDLIHNTMPQDKPGTLSPDATVDVIAYLLQFNKFPAGSTELKSDPATLKNILITNKKSAAPPPKQ